MEPCLASTNASAKVEQSLNCEFQGYQKIFKLNLKKYCGVVITSGKGETNVEDLEPQKKTFQFPSHCQLNRASYTVVIGRDTQCPQT